MPNQSRVLPNTPPLPENFAAWLDETRRTVGSKFYDVDPFAEVFSFREGVYHLLHESPEGSGDTPKGGNVWVHVIVGPEKVFVIDTAWGLGNLAGLVAELSGGREPIVCNTHPHLDHAYGDICFERVYCHEYCAPMLEMDTVPEAWDPFLDENGNGRYLHFTRDDIAPFRKPEIIPCANHTVFNLGGDHNIELIWSPGHAAGGAVFIDHKNRILFSGDSYGPYTSMVGASPLPRLLRVYKNEHLSVKSFLNETIELAARTDEFDIVYSSHNILGQDPQIIKDMETLLRAVDADPDCYDEIIYNRHKLAVYIKRVGLAGLMYGDFAVGRGKRE